MWWRFRRHRLAVVGVARDRAVYLVAALRRLPRAVRRPTAHRRRTIALPPQADPLLRPTGSFRARTCYGAARARATRMTLRARRTTPDPSAKHPVRFFAPGCAYKLFGLIPTDSTCSASPRARATARVFLFGADAPGPRQSLAHDLRRRGSRSRSAWSAWSLSLRARRAPRRHLRLLRRRDRHAHPAGHRVHPLDPDDPALDGLWPRRCRRTGRCCRSTSRSR